MIWVLNFIEFRDRGIVVYFIKIILVALVPTFLVALLVYPWLEDSSFGEETDFSIVDAFGFVVFAPLAETGLLVAMIVLWRRFGLQRREQIVIASALVWAGLHALFVPVWGAVVFWNFCVWTAVYLDWERRSRVEAFWIVFFIHAFNNAISAIVSFAYE